MFTIRRPAVAFVCRRCRYCMRGRQFTTSAAMRSLFEDMDSMASREEQRQARREASEPTGEADKQPSRNHYYNNNNRDRQPRRWANANPAEKEERNPFPKKKFGRERHRGWETGQKERLLDQLDDFVYDKQRNLGMKRRGGGGGGGGWNKAGANYKKSGNVAETGNRKPGRGGGGVNRELWGIHTTFRGQSGELVPEKQISYKNQVRALANSRADRLINDFGINWSDTDLRPIILKAMKEAFPWVEERMTKTQRGMVALLNENYSLVVRGFPASGKSFTIALWLLGVQRAVKMVDAPDGSVVKKPTLTALVLVPSTELGEQYGKWFSELLAKFEVDGADTSEKPPDAKIFQVLYRGPREVEDEQERLLREHPNPHIIVSTPKRLLDLLDGGAFEDCLDIKNARKVVVDEADFLLTQLKHGVTDEEIKQLKHIKKKRKSGIPVDSPSGKILDYIFDRSYRARASAAPNTHQIQLVLVSSTANTRLRATAIFNKHWLVRYEDHGAQKSTAQLPENSMPVIGIDNQGMQESIIQKAIPGNINHHVVFFDRATGVMADAPLPELTEEEVISESFEFQIPDLEKTKQRLRAMNESRFEGMSAEEANQSVKDELMQVHLETAGAFSAEQETVVARYYRSGIGSEIVGTLLHHDNYPKDVIVFIHPLLSKRLIMDELRESDFNVKDLTSANLAERRDQPPRRRDERGLEEEMQREPADTTVWISDANSCRGLDTRDFHYAYIIYPWTRPYQYVHMCGRIARSAFPGHRNAPKGSVTSVILADAVVPGTVDDDASSPGLVLQGHPSEKKQWRDIALRLGRLKVRAKPYFADETLEPVLEPLDFEEEEEEDVDLPNRHENRPEQAIVEEKEEQQPGKYEGLAFQFLDEVMSEQESEPASSSQGQGAAEDTTENEEGPAAVSSSSEEVTDPSAEALTQNDLQDNLHMTAAAVARGGAESAAPATDSSPHDIVLEDSPHFLPEGESGVLEEVSMTDSSEITSTAETEQPEEVDEHAHLLHKELEIGPNVTKEEAEEFQKAQDEIFASFLELQKLMDDVKKKQEEMKNGSTDEVKADDGEEK